MRREAPRQRWRKKSSASEEAIYEPLAPSKVRGRHVGVKEGEGSQEGRDEDIISHEHGRMEREKQPVANLWHKSTAQSSSGVGRGAQ